MLRRHTACVSMTCRAADLMRGYGMWVPGFFPTEAGMSVNPKDQRVGAELRGSVTVHFILSGYPSIAPPHIGCV